ncbi:MAG: HesA/MoeB/ThiF family protein [Nitrospirae bacterium]|nr:HesA/MoeB/ThiF family protein [Nitrospirota bacterium]
MLDGFTEAQQQKLKDSTVLVAGIGGLGGTAAIYLAVAGIGKMIFAHYGKLTLTNMNRQILMKDNWIGKSRVIQGMKSIKDLNPEVEVEIYDERTSESNIEKLLSGANLALSARPTFHERRVLNEACIKKGVPLVEAAMNGMEGYLFNIVPGVTACLNCVYPDNNPEWEELGFPVLGAVSGMLGCLMSIEAIKLLTGYGKPLMSKMLIFNTIDMEFRKFKVHKNPDCEVCGTALNSIDNFEAEYN